MTTQVHRLGKVLMNISNTCSLSLTKKYVSKELNIKKEFLRIVTLNGEEIEHGCRLPPIVLVIVKCKICTDCK